MAQGTVACHLILEPGVANDRIDLDSGEVASTKSWGAQLAPLEQIDLRDDEELSVEKNRSEEEAVGSEDPGAGRWDLQERLRQTGRDQSRQA